MKKEEVRKKVIEIGIVPVVRATSVANALAATEAVAAGGIPVAEITMTVPGAIEVIAELSKTSGNRLLIGAGTVLDAATAQQCIKAGAQFLVSPGFDLATVKAANEAGILIMAGALTPTEVITAWKSGADFVKVYPASAVGGPSYIKALRAPLPQIPLVPTGGVNLDTAKAFLDAGSSALGIGGELVLASALKSGNTSAITDLARKYVAIIQAKHAENLVGASA